MQSNRIVALTERTQFTGFPAPTLPGWWTAARVATLFMVAGNALAACGAENPGVTGAGIQNPKDTTSAPAGNPCDSVRDLQKCMKPRGFDERWQCDKGVWVKLEVCDPGLVCVETPTPEKKIQASCALPTAPDAGSAEVAVVDAAGDIIGAPDAGGADSTVDVASGDVPTPDAPKNACGDGKCNAPENIATCPIDCQAPASCGNALCEPGEDESNCPEDCAYASEFMLCLQAKCKSPYQKCNLSDSCGPFMECAIDCGGTVKCIDLCLVGLADSALGLAKGVVGCAYDNQCYPTKCGDGACQGPSENGVNCSKDCKVGGPVCGDHICVASESHSSCPGDCKDGGASCGNGQCEPGETPANCNQDCKTPLTSGCKGLCGKQSQENGKQCFCDDLCTEQVPPDCCSDKATLCPSTCTKKCSGKVCGPDGCGGECAPCGDGAKCKTDGTACETVSTCGNKVCDAGEDTATCPGDCPCVKTCDGKVCGSDGCGGLCAKCATGANCNTGGTQCVPKTCGNKICDTGETATNCAGDCKATCTPACAGKKCGPDGCGGSCGPCQSGQTCKTDGTACTCTKQCTGKVCGSDGCGGTCGPCAAPSTCSADGKTCAGACTKQCAGKVCGPDGCGGTCGPCVTPSTCSADGKTCAATCTKQCSGKVCGPDGCGGTCGAVCSIGKDCKTDGTVCISASCGNGVCASNETATSCAKDCAPAAVGCQNNCSKPSKTATGVPCFCDDFCQSSGDCCADKAKWCP
ncbi:MAG: hypothetical protein EXR79_09845 [Myxococcales bacterium]|nr:hypothetical protein [Myxococcales bacterium]